MIGRILFSLLFVFICLPTAHAQFTAGLLGGVTFSQVDGDQISGYNKAGFTGGVLIDYGFNESWKGGFEILYTMKGSKSIVDPDIPNSTLFRLKYDYVEFPLKATYTWEQFSFYGGPTVGVNIVAKRDELGLGYMDTEVRRFEFGAVLGAQYNLTDEFGFGVRHQNSVVRIWNHQFNNGLNIWNRPGLYNRLFAVYAVWRLGEKS